MLSDQQPPHRTGVSRRVQGTSIVVIGCSLGCVPALMTLMEELDANWPAAVFVHLHTGRHRSVLPALLRPRCPMKVTFAEDAMPILSGHVYVAPPDRHLCICDNDIRLSYGPRIHWARPAVDPMFCSAAKAH